MSEQPPSFLDLDDALIQGEQVDADSCKAPEPTDLAKRVHRLKKSAFTLASKRERIPQTLFWSVFGLELAEIKKRKEKERFLRKMLYDGHE